MSFDKFDTCVIGAGVVGLAIARELAVKGQSVILIEKESLYGSEISSRNSEVIHAGIYYPTNSLKAKLCVEGKELLYKYCKQFNVPHNRIGKLIVSSTREQEEDLIALQKKAETNGVYDLKWIPGQKLRELEPQVKGNQALLSPSTGIIDSHNFMTSLAGQLESHGGLLSLNTKFINATKSTEGFRINVTSVGENFQFECTNLINSAGLGAQTIAGNIEGIETSAIPQLYLCKGCYFTYTGKSPFNTLIYPMPEPNTTGLGVHATLDLGGQVKFGPDTEYIDTEDYQVPESRRSKFAKAIKLYFPDLDETKLTPSYSGIRPKIQGPGQPAEDFRIEQPIPGVINLFGIESPGLTSSLAIAKHVANKL